MAEAETGSKNQRDDEDQKNSFLRKGEKITDKEDKSEHDTFENIPLSSNDPHEQDDASARSRYSEKQSSKRSELYNPYENETKVFKRNDSALMSTLQTSAVEVYVEFFGMTRVELFGKSHCIAVIFNEGTSPGSWEPLDHGQQMPCEFHMRCFKKFRLRAGTEIDRAETYMVALFALDNARIPEKSLQASNAWAYTEFTVGEVLDCEQMMLERRLKYGKSGVMAKGTVSLTLDVIYHVEGDRKVSIDFGFLPESPRRNRMYFEICKALRRGKWIPLYRSEIRCHDEAHEFKQVSFQEQEFHGGDLSKLIRLELFRWYKNGKTKLLGFIQTNYEKLSSLKPNDQLYWWPAENGISIAKVVVQGVKSDNRELVLSLRLANMF